MPFTFVYQTQADIYSKQLGESADISAVRYTNLKGKVVEKHDIRYKDTLSNYILFGMNSMCLA